MLSDESLVESFERTSLNFQHFSEDMASTASIIGKMAEEKGVSKELRSLFISLNKLSRSYYEFRKEYLELVKESLSDTDLKSTFESIITENEGCISDANEQISRFN